MLGWNGFPLNGSTEGIRLDSAARGVVGDRLSMLLLVAMALTSLYCVFGVPSPTQSAHSPPVRSLQVSQARDGAMAASCRTVHWCSKPFPAPPAMRWVAEAEGEELVAS